MKSYDTFCKWFRWPLFFTIALCILLLLKGCEEPGFTMEAPINIQRLADAIYYSEGGNKTRWPYGIKHHYKHTTARQACLNTIKHRLKIWHRKGDFVTYLGLTYSPPSINPNWVRLVTYFYNKGE